MQNNENNEVKICTRCKREISYYDKTCYYCGEEFEVEYPDERAEYIQMIKLHLGTGVLFYSP